MIQTIIGNKWINDIKIEISEVKDFIKGFRKQMWNLKQKFRVARLVFFTTMWVNQRQGKWMFFTKRAKIWGRGILSWGQHLNVIPHANPRQLAVTAWKAWLKKIWKFSLGSVRKCHYQLAICPLSCRLGKSHMYRSPCPWPSWYALSLEFSPNSHAKFIANIIRGEHWKHL